MRPHKPRIYLDTSVISYHAARLHRDPVVRKRQLATQKWWEIFRGKSDFYVSTYVLEEIADGDPHAARKRLELVSGFAGVVSNLKSERFGERLFRELNIPLRSKTDAWHLSIAALTRLDYIVSWNFKHMANNAIRAAYENCCQSVGLPAPVIKTPEQMLKGEF